MNLYQVGIHWRDDQSPVTSQETAEAVMAWAAGGHVEEAIDEGLWLVYLGDFEDRLLTNEYLEEDVQLPNQPVVRVTAEMS